MSCDCTDDCPTCEPFEIKFPPAEKIVHTVMMSKEKYDELMAELEKLREENKQNYKKQLDTLINNIRTISYKSNENSIFLYQCRWCNNLEYDKKYMTHKDDCPMGFAENAFDAMFEMQE